MEIYAGYHYDRHRARLPETNLVPNARKNPKIIKIVVSRYYQRVYVDAARPALRKSLLPKGLRQSFTANTVPINILFLLKKMHALSPDYQRLYVNSLLFFILFLGKISHKKFKQVRHTKTNRGK